MKRKWNLEAMDQDGNDISEQTSAEFEVMVQATRLEQIAPDRISVLLLSKLFGAYKAGRIDPSQVAREIEALEKGETTGLKKPIQNRHPPLKGLWHKHYMQLCMDSLKINVQNGLERFRIPYFDQKMREAQEAGEARYLTIDDIAPIVNDIVQGNFRRLLEAESLTGEWIVFAKRETLNYYLTLATHDKTTHEHERQLIESICYCEFPFLEEVLRNEE